MHSVLTVPSNAGAFSSTAISGTRQSCVTSTDEALRPVQHKLGCDMELTLCRRMTSLAPDVELVERKGRGHPDTLADRLAEHLSIIRSEIDQAKRYPYVYAYPPKGAYRMMRGR